MPYDPDRHGPRRVVGPGFYERVYRAVLEVPPGSVTTYGAIAAGLGLKTAARQVGYALAALPEHRDDVPWHRVVNARGRISARGDGGRCDEQARRLESEGLQIDQEGRIANFKSALFSWG